jgi:hypothetical protein
MGETPKPPLKAVNDGGDPQTPLKAPPCPAP